MNYIAVKKLNLLAILLPLHSKLTLAYKSQKFGNSEVNTVTLEAMIFYNNKK